MENWKDRVIIANQRIKFFAALFSSLTIYSVRIHQTVSIASHHLRINYINIYRINKYVDCKLSCITRCDITRMLYYVHNATIEAQPIEWKIARDCCEFLREKGIAKQSMYRISLIEYPSSVPRISINYWVSSGRPGSWMQGHKISQSHNPQFSWKKTWYMGVSKNSGTLKWMVYKGKPEKKNGTIWGYVPLTTIYQSTQIPSDIGSCTSILLFNLMWFT